MSHSSGYGWRTALPTALAASAALLVAAAAPAQVLGPLNPGAEDGNTNWFSGQGGTHTATIDTTNPATGTAAFQIGGTARDPGEGAEHADWRSASFLLNGVGNGGQGVNFSFRTRVLGTVAGGDDIRVQLRFFQTTGGGIFLGEENVLIGSSSGHSAMADYALVTRNNITVPPLAQSADIRFSSDIFEPWGSGQARFDDFQVSVVPEPASLAGLGLAVMTLAARRRHR